MMPPTRGLPVVASTTRRIVIEQVPTGVVGEWGMTVSFEGIPEGWSFAHQILAGALSEVAWQMVLEDRRRRPTTPTLFLTQAEGTH